MLSDVLVGFDRFPSDSGTKLFVSHSQIAVLLHLNVVMMLESSGSNQCRLLAVPLKDRIAICLKMCVVLFPPTAHAASTAQQNASPSSSQDHQETSIHRFRNCTVSRLGPNEQPPHHHLPHLVLNMLSAHSSHQVAG